jgi:hypothetical protein
MLVKITLEFDKKKQAKWKSKGFWVFLWKKARLWKSHLTHFFDYGSVVMPPRKSFSPPPHLTLLPYTLVHIWSYWVVTAISHEVVSEIDFMENSHDLQVKKGAKGKKRPGRQQSWQISQAEYWPSRLWFSPPLASSLQPLLGWGPVIVKNLFRFCKNEADGQRGST